MYEVFFAPSFIRQAKKLDKILLDVLYEKIDLLKKRENHEFLRVHKLHGKYADCYAFSLNSKFRAVFEFELVTQIKLLRVGDHGVYKKRG